MDFTEGTSGFFGLSRLFRLLRSRKERIMLRFSLILILDRQYLHTAHSKEELIRGLTGYEYRKVKLSTTQLKIEADKKYPLRIAGLKNVKIIFKTGKGVLILLGNLQCHFGRPFGGQFYCTRTIDETTNFDDIRGTLAELRLIDGNDNNLNYISEGDLTSIEDMQEQLAKLKNDPDFPFEISQFKDFTELFNFYKELSNELNNSATFEITSITPAYKFIPVSEAGDDIGNAEEVTNINSVLVGYRLGDIDLLSMSNDAREKVKTLVDVRIKGGFDEIKKIKKAGLDNIYVSNLHAIEDERQIRSLEPFFIVNMKMTNGELILSGEFKSEEKYRQHYAFLNIYDMGTKIKVESIDRSLKLINQGATGAATTLLEYLIGKREMPNNPGGRTINAAKQKYMSALNESQKQAFLMVLDGSPVSLIKGPPGTGKTYVINAIVQYITKELRQKVIVSSQTHIAIDNVLDILMQSHDLIIPNRITNRFNKYSRSEIDKTLYRTWGVNFPKHNLLASNRELAEKIARDIADFKGDQRIAFSSETLESDYRVIGVTTTTSAIAGRKGLEVLDGYDWLIIDEVSKCPITEVFRFLPYVKYVVMVGDDFQLAPLLEFSKEDVEHLPSYDEDKFNKLRTMYEQSVFAKVLDKAKAAGRLVQLNENYRSVRHVLEVYNVFYNSKLIGRRESIRPEKVSFADDDLIDCNKSDAFFIEVKNGQEVKEGTSRYNIEEIKATTLILQYLIGKVRNPKAVTVAAIFPYAAQINYFERWNSNTDLINKAKKTFRSFEVDTVDAFQGKEADIVLVDTVVTDCSQRNFLSDFRRINVSMSRARDKLFLFGNSITLEKIGMKTAGGEERHYFREIIDYITKNGTMIVYTHGGIKNEDRSKNPLGIL